MEALNADLSGENTYGFSPSNNKCILGALLGEIGGGGSAFQSTPQMEIAEMEGMMASVVDILGFCSAGKGCF